MSIGSYAVYSVTSFFLFTVRANVELFRVQKNNLNQCY